MSRLEEYGFASNAPANKETTLMQAVEKRAEAEVQAAYVIAKKFPRDMSEVSKKIESMCVRPLLAEKAFYQFPKGGQKIRGASIRLAEALAQAYGNIDAGVREISRNNGVSVAEAYAIDLETNTRITKTFHVSHMLDLKGGKKKLLTSERDIYEMVANQGSRRLRACILAAIPGDICEMAENMCEDTLRAMVKNPGEVIARMKTTFENDFGVTIEMICKRFGCNEQALGIEQIMSLKGIYRSLKDGMSSPQDWFPEVAVNNKPHSEDIKAQLEQSIANNVEQPMPEKQPQPVEVKEEPKEDVQDILKRNMKELEDKKKAKKGE
jgi:hypothetical protein